MDAEVAEVEMAEASDDGEDAEGEAGDEADEVDGFHGGQLVDFVDFLRAGFVCAAAARLRVRCWVLTSGLRTWKRRSTRVGVLRTASRSRRQRRESG